jgi:hypothetical protein
VQEIIEAGGEPPGVEIPCSIEDVKLIRISSDPIFIADELCSAGEANYEYWVVRS